MTDGWNMDQCISIATAMVKRVVQCTIAAVVMVTGVSCGPEQRTSSSDAKVAETKAVSERAGPLATNPDVKEPVVPSVTNFGELTDQDGKIVATVLVIRLEIPTAFIQPDVSAALKAEQTGSGSPYSRWLYRPVLIEFDGRSVPSSRKSPLRNALTDKKGSGEYAYTVVGVIPGEVPRDAFKLSISDPGYPFRSEDSPHDVPAVRIAVPKRSSRPALRPLALALQKTALLPGGKAEVVFRTNWGLEGSSIPGMPGMESIRIGNVQCEGPMTIRRNMEDGLQTISAVCTMPSLPVPGSPILLKVDRVEGWIAVGAVQAAK